MPATPSNNIETYRKMFSNSKQRPVKYGWTRRKIASSRKWASLRLITIVSSNNCIVRSVKQNIFFEKTEGAHVLFWDIWCDVCLFYFGGIDHEFTYLEIRSCPVLGADTLAHYRVLAPQFASATTMESEWLKIASWFWFATIAASDLQIFCPLVRQFDASRLSITCLLVNEFICGIQHLQWTDVWCGQWKMAICTINSYLNSVFCLQHWVMKRILFAEVFSN